MFQKCNNNISSSNAEKTFSCEIAPTIGQRERVSCGIDLIVPYPEQVEKWKSHRVADVDKCIQSSVASNYRKINKWSKQQEFMSGKNECVQRLPLSKSISIWLFLSLSPALSGSLATQTIPDSQFAIRTHTKCDFIKFNIVGKVAQLNTMVCQSSEERV